MFILFVVAAVLWTVLVVKAGTNAHRIHHLMIALVVFKALTLLSQVRLRHPCLNCPPPGRCRAATCEASPLQPCISVAVSSCCCSVNL